MNGAPPPPHTMPRAPYTNPHMPPPVTGRSFLKIGLTLLCLGAIVLGGIAWALKMKGASLAAATGEKQTGKPWKAQSVYPPLEEKAVAAAAEKPEDPNAARLAALERQQQAILNALNALKNRKVASTTVVPPAPQPAQAVHKPSTKYAEPLFIANKLETAPAVASVPEYVLAPGATKLPCEIETAMHSDVEGYFTAKVTANVYDTATGQHLLVPQGSTILANDQSSKLIYGNERMDTVSLKLALQDGRSVDLGEAPVTDQAGVAGLTGDVNQHYGRLLAAVLIQGVLKGGTTAIASAAGAGQVVSGLAGAGNQAVNKVTGPMLNTRPTIKVDAGQLCTVILLQELTLPAMWQGRVAMKGK